LAQLKYGALDAFVLIQIHDFIQARIKELGVEFNYKKNYF
jgi:ribonuclease D